MYVCVCLHHSDYFTFNVKDIIYVPFTSIIFIDVQIVLSLALGTLEIMSLLSSLPTTVSLVRQAHTCVPFSSSFDLHPPSFISFYI